MATINRKVSARELRRKLQAEAEVAAAALQNEQVTRQRVKGLEAGIEYLASVLGRGFWGRLRWLALGK
jgi:hypothetical protein